MCVCPRHPKSRAFAKVFLELLQGTGVTCPVLIAKKHSALEPDGEFPVTSVTQQQFYFHFQGSCYH